MRLIFREKYKTMAFALVGLALVLTSGCGNRQSSAEDDSGLLEMTTSNRRPISEATSSRGAGQYARANAYAGAANLREGMRLMFSASYGGSGGEAGQARGRLVKSANGDFYFKMEANPTNQLLYAPGLPQFGGGVSLWNITKYVDLINKVSFADAGGTRGDGEAVYGQVSGAIVDFKGGTAGGTASHSDTLELVLKARSGETSSETKVYYAKGVGPVALEFRETGLVGGTFKMYIGE